MKFSTKAIHEGQAADPATGATIVPIYQTSTFSQAGIGENKGFEYSRSGNPTRAALETCIAALEDGRHGLAFASGMAATNTAVSILRPGDHVVAAEDIYGGTYRLFEQVLKPMGVAFTYVNAADAEDFGAAIRPNTRLAWIESPTNPLLQLADIAAVAAQTRPRGVPLAVDNTFATPYLQQPLALGADIVVHSTTKYIGGHSDVIGGAIVVNDTDLHKALKFHQNAAGAVPGPFDAWLTLRGAKTLAVRMRQHCENAQRVAEQLAGHPAVEAVFYPGLATHPQHDLAKRQMKAFGGMVSFNLRGGREAVNAFVHKLRLFSFAESLGGVESLAAYPAAMSHAGMPREERERRGITDGTVRLSVGIEDIEDILQDLDGAMSASA
jgi:cystathionine beta-lyase/cystathionine gamma-synthase